VAPEPVLVLVNLWLFLAFHQLTKSLNVMHCAQDAANLSSFVIIVLLCVMFRLHYSDVCGDSQVIHTKVIGVIAFSTCFV